MTTKKSPKCRQPAKGPTVQEIKDRRAAAFQVIAARSDARKKEGLRDGLEHAARFPSPDPDRGFRAALGVITNDLPKTELGEKFSSGRKPGTFSRLKKLLVAKIAPMLKQQRRVTPKKLWYALQERPPSGWRINGHPIHPEDAWIEYLGPGAKGPQRWSFKRFCNIVGEVKKE